MHLTGAFQSCVSALISCGILHSLWLPTITPSGPTPSSPIDKCAFYLESAPGSIAHTLRRVSQDDSMEFNYLPCGVRLPQRSTRLERHIQTFVPFQCLSVSNLPPTELELFEIQNAILPPLDQDIVVVDSEITATRLALEFLEQERDALANIKQNIKTSLPHNVVYLQKSGQRSSCMEIPWTTGNRTKCLIGRLASSGGSARCVRPGAILLCLFLRAGRLLCLIFHRAGQHPRRT